MTRPFVDRPVADRDGARDAAERAAVRWSLGRPTLVRMGMNAIFGTDDAVLRVSSPTAAPEAALELADVLLVHGLRVARPLRDDAVVVGDLAVTCWERIEDAGAPIDWPAVGEMVRRVHQLDRRTLPAAYPLPSPSSFPWWDFDRLLADTRSEIDDAAIEGLERAIRRHAGWRDFSDEVVCHGDVHPGNVMSGPRGPVLLDWDLLCSAPAAWDHAPLMTWHERWGGERGTYEAFADGYGASYRGDPAAEGFAELRLVAATLMRVRTGRTDPLAAAEARRRLAYWRDEPDAPVWSAQ